MASLYDAKRQSRPALPAGKGQAGAALVCIEAVRVIDRVIWPARAAAHSAAIAASMFIFAARRAGAIAASSPANAAAAT